MSVRRVSFRSLGAAAVLLSTLALLAVFVSVPASASPLPTAYSSSFTLVPPSGAAVAVYRDGTQRGVCDPTPSSTCTYTDLQFSSDGRPSDGWPRYTFTNTFGNDARHYYWDRGACDSSPGYYDRCELTNDKQDATVGGYWVQFWYSTLTVETPPTGRGVLRTATGQEVTSCTKAEGTTCNVLDRAVTADGAPRPTTGWSTYVFDAELPPKPGFRYVVDSGCATPCTLTNDQADGHHGGAWHDIESPVATVAPSRPVMTRDGMIEIKATDNDAVARQRYTLCHAVTCSTTTSSVGGLVVRELAEGDWTVSVTVEDAAGNMSAPRSASFTIDNTSPLITVDTPGGFPRSGGFRFHVDEAHPGTTECRLDGGAYVPCESPWRPADITVGAHDILVRTTDAAGNIDSLSATYQVAKDAFVATARVTGGGYGTPHAVALQDLGTAGGSVTFTAAGKVLCTVGVEQDVARCNAPATLLPGRYLVTGTYSGDAEHEGGSATATLTVVRAKSKITARPGAGVVRRGHPVRLTVTGLAASATGTVVFRDGRAVLCRATVRSRAATCLTGALRTVRTYRVTATYGGDVRWLAASATTRFRVTK